MGRFWVVSAACILVLGTSSCSPSDYRVEFSGPENGYWLSDVSLPDGWD